MRPLLLNIDILKNITPVNPLQDTIERTQRQSEKIQRSIQQSKKAKETEELRRHNEMIAALKSAGENGATIIVGDNANGIQIQHNSNYSSQEMINSQTFDYDKALEALKEIQGYFDFRQFSDTF